MKEMQERSQSMRAYANSHAEPDAETTARMRERLQDAMNDRVQKRQRSRAWVQSAALTLVAIVGVATLAWWRGWIGAPGELDHRGVISTSDIGQEIAVGDGRAVLAPHTLVRMVDEPEGVALELVEGEVALRDAPGIVVRVGAYEVRGPSRDVVVRRTPGVPLVTVREGTVVLAGPDLPDAGVTMAPTGG
jgi:hypothetical protein